MLSEHFKREEFACNCGCGFDTVDKETLEVLESVRVHFGVPVHVTSGCRCPAYNAKVGGSKNSFHVKGRAADIVVEGVPPHLVQAYLKGRYEGQYGIGCYDTFTHVDTRTGKQARW